MKPEDRRRYERALSLGMSMAVGMAVFAGLGWWLDRRRGGGVGFTLAGCAAGLLFAVYETWKAVRDLEADDEPRRPGRPGGGPTG